MLERLRKMNSKTRWFVFNWVIYFLCMIATTLYCYGRLDFVRTKNLSEHVKKT